MNINGRVFGILLASSSTLLFACDEDSGEVGGGSAVSDREAEVTSALKTSIADDIDGWAAGVAALCAAAPEHAWGPSDAASIDAMRGHWREARAHYEHIEGAIAPLYPDIDFATDARYDDYLAELGPAGDPDPFDGEGVTGMHGIERILYADKVPAAAVEFESSLPGYAPAAAPTTDADALAFKNELCAQLSADIATLEASWDDENTRIDLALAFQGLTDLMNEQAEKVNLAASGEEESRYSQLTMADLRTNLDGARVAYAIFSPWIVEQGGADIDSDIQAGLAAIDAAYAEVDGDAIPAPPASWNPETPSEEDLETDFGRLYSAIREAVDPTRNGSVVSRMNDAGALLGLQ